MVHHTEFDWTVKIIHENYKQKGPNYLITKNVVNILIIKENLCLLFDIFLVNFKNIFAKFLIIYGQLKFNRQLNLMLCTCHSM